MNQERSEEDLVAASRRGDRAAFSRLVRMHQERVYWVVLRMVGDHDDALDLAQEVFIRAWEKLDRFRGDARFFTWLYRIAMNMTLNHLRRSKLRSFLPLADHEDAVEEHDPGPAEQLESEQLREMIADAIETLPEKQRAVFVLRYFEELPYEEISTILNTSTGGLKANYHHAVRKIEHHVKAHL